MYESVFDSRAYARVYILDNPYAIDRPFDYYIPHDLSTSSPTGNAILPGCFVTVPFGRGNRKQLAVVTETFSSEEYANIAKEGDKKLDLSKLKPVDSVCSGNSRSELILSGEQLALCSFLKEQTLCTFGEAVRTVVPPSTLARLVKYYKPTGEKLPQSLEHADLLVYEYISSRGEASEGSLYNRFGKSVDSQIERLLQKKLITKELNLHAASKVPVTRMYSLGISPDDALLITKKDKSAPIKLSSALQLSALDTALYIMSENERSEVSEQEISSRSNATPTQLKALVKKGILQVNEVPAWRDPYAALGLENKNENSTVSPFLLSEEQTNAYEKLTAMADGTRPAAALLHGVTGSGKTAVILSLIDRILEGGRGAIVLLPEISLTPQMSAQFLSRYGSNVAVLHSGLSQGERHDAFVRIRRGLANVVVGTRSAVFAPVKDLALIVIDEEQEHTYKSDKNPKYHARDIARFRCAYNNALMLLSSATPSLESYEKAIEGKYTLIKMKDRFGGATLPRVIIKDMRDELRGSSEPLSGDLISKLSDNFEKGDQSVLFLNRRGYSTQVVCRSCGQAVLCKNCSVAMNYHTKRGTYSSGELVCHWCGSRRPYPDACPECASPHMVRMGFGTQKVEEELSRLISDAKVLRMDADTTSTKFSYNDLLDTFRRHDADILLGTQMVTKGHDFPDVTLVGVLLADMSLYLDDYRASERTFSMLTQVIGRAGRGEKSGVALIQTMNPDNDIIKLACAQDYELFFDREIKIRKLLTFPPFCDIALITLSSSDENLLNISAVKLSEEIKRLSQKDFSDMPLITFGPFEAPVYRVENQYRMRMVIKCRLNRESRRFFSQILTEFSRDSSSGTSSKPTLSIDFNPSSL